MCTRVHIWKCRSYDGSLSGHAALQLSDDTYMSWRKSMIQGQGEDQVKANVTTYLDDCNFEGRPPDKSYQTTAQFVDESLVTCWWQNRLKTNTLDDQGEITPSYTVLEGVMAGLGWTRSKGGYTLSSKDLVDQLLRLGVISDEDRRCCSIQ